jgi:nucleotide-binding universal stress UspA family protein
MKLNSLLMPHDGSELSGSMVDTLGPLLRDAGHVTLLHVDDGQEVDPSRLAETERRLKALGARVTQREVRSDDPAGAIVNVAGEAGFDLIVMSTLGRSGIERWIRGSVAERVLRSSPIPVLMVNPRTEAGSSFSSVLVPLDTTDDAAHILDLVLPFAAIYKSTLTLLSVNWEDPTDTPTRATQRRSMHTQHVEESFAIARARIEEVGIAVRIEIAHGDVAEEIVRAAQPGNHDLIAMTTHGHSGSRRWLLGSVAEKVLSQCRIPILLRRIPAIK